MNKVEMGKTYRTRDGRPVRILCTDRKSHEYPVIALVSSKHIENDIVLYLTAFGRMDSESRNDFHYDSDLIEVSPWDDFKIDDPVMVRNEGAWLRRHFAGVQDGQPTTWDDGTTSWSSVYGQRSHWDECRKPTEEILKAI